MRSSAVVAVRARSQFDVRGLRVQQSPVVYPNCQVCHRRGGITRRTYFSQSISPAGRVLARPRVRDALEGGVPPADLASILLSLQGPEAAITTQGLPEGSRQSVE